MADIAVYDDFSFESLLPKSLCGHWGNVPEAVREMSENALKRHISNDTLRTTEMMRDAFWGEHGLAITEGRPIRSGKIYEGICSRAVFWRYVTDPYRLAYIFKPVMAYERALVTLLREKGIDQLRNIMELDVVSHGALVFNAIKFTTDRLYGSPTQTLKEERTVHVNLVPDKSPEYINKRLKELEDQLGRIDKKGAIDAEFTEAKNE
jgi:hypothetical protein